MFSSRPKGRRNFFRKTQVSSYQVRRFKNPYFQNKTNHSKWPFAIAGLVIGFFIALTSFFFTAPVFTITAVRVEGAESVNPKEIRQIAEDYISSRSLLIFKRNNRFLCDEKELKKDLEKKYSFSSLKIDREGHTLAIILKEKVSSFLWLTNNQSFILDNTGTVIRAISSEESQIIMNPPLLQGPTKDGSLIPESIKILVFRDLENKPVAVGKVTLTEAEVKNIRLFFDAMQAFGISIESFELNKSIGAWLKAITRNGYDILFDPTTDVLEQANNVSTLLRGQIKDIATLEYIDVRFGDHVYYK